MDSYSIIVLTMRDVIFKVLYVGSRGLRRISSILSKAALKNAPDGIQQSMVIASTSYDMVRESDEPFYAEQYWNIIYPFFGGITESAQCLDLGCGQGRLSLKLAKNFPKGRVFACDISGSAIASAMRYADEAGVSNVEFTNKSIEDALRSYNEARFDIVIMTEVAFFYPDWYSQLPRILKVLLPNGLLIMSFRSQLFNGWCIARERLWHNVGMLLEKRRGHIFDSLTEFNWHISRELYSIFTSVPGLELLKLQGIGVCSGIPGDPHEQICKPSLLDTQEKAKLMELELELGKTVPDAGRYILTVARKTNG